MRWLRWNFRASFCLETQVGYHPHRIPRTATSEKYFTPVLLVISESACHDSYVIPAQHRLWCPEKDSSKKRLPVSHARRRSIATGTSHLCQIWMDIEDDGNARMELGQPKSWQKMQGWAWPEFNYMELGQTRKLHLQDACLRSYFPMFDHQMTWIHVIHFEQHQYHDEDQKKVEVWHIEGHIPSLSLSLSLYIYIHSRLVCLYYDKGVLTCR